MPRPRPYVQARRPLQSLSRPCCCGANDQTAFSQLPPLAVPTRAATAPRRLCAIGLPSAPFFSGWAVRMRCEIYKREICYLDASFVLSPLPSCSPATKVWYLNLVG